MVGIEVFTKPTPAFWSGSSEMKSAVGGGGRGEGRGGFSACTFVKKRGGDGALLDIS